MHFSQSAKDWGLPYDSRYFWADALVITVTTTTTIIIIIIIIIIITVVLVHRFR